MACQNDGIFYSVADSADLSTVMSSYYTYFAAAVTDTNARWVLYNDFATGTELLSACAPMYDNADSNGLVSVLMGVLCMDINIIESVEQLRQRSDWNDLYSRVLADTDQCTAMWVGLDTETEQYDALEYIRQGAVTEGAQTCGSDYAPDKNDKGVAFPWWAYIIIVGVVVVGAIGTRCVKTLRLKKEASADARNITARKSFAELPQDGGVPGTIPTPAAQPLGVDPAYAQPQQGYYPQPAGYPQPGGYAQPDATGVYTQQGQVVTGYDPATGLEMKVATGGYPDPAAAAMAPPVAMYVPAQTMAPGDPGAPPPPPPSYQVAAVQDHGNAAI